MRKYDQPPAPDPRLAEMPIEWLRCRARRQHNWLEAGDEVLETYRGEVVLFVNGLRCDRCSTLRFDTIDLRPWWWLAGRRYDYPDGYLLDGIPVDPRAAQMELLRRTTTIKALRRA